MNRKYIQNIIGFRKINPLKPQYHVFKSDINDKILYYLLNEKQMTILDIISEKDMSNNLLESLRYMFNDRRISIYSIRNQYCSFEPDLNIHIFVNFSFNIETIDMDKKIFDEYYRSVFEKHFQCNSDDLANKILSSKNELELICYTLGYNATNDVVLQNFKTNILPYFLNVIDNK